MAQPFLSVIIPSYNEAKRLPLTLIDIDKRLSQAEYSYEIIVVNDGSKDDTAEITAKMAAGAIKNLKLIDNSENQGKGGVVRQGMLAAKGKYRLFTDADNSVTVDYFDKMLPYLREGSDVAICSRAVKGSTMDPPQPFYRQLPGKIGNLVIQTLVLWGIWDTQCGFKAMSEEAVMRIFPLTKINGWGFDVEILALAKKFGFKIKEIPVRWVNDPHSHVKASAYIKVLLEVFKIRWWLWTGKYNIGRQANSES